MIRTLCDAYLVDDETIKASAGDYFENIAPYIFVAAIIIFVIIVSVILMKSVIRETKEKKSENNNPEKDDSNEGD